MTRERNSGPFFSTKMELNSRLDVTARRFISRQTVAPSGVIANDTASRDAVSSLKKAPIQRQTALNVTLLLSSVKERCLVKLLTNGTEQDFVKGTALRDAVN